MKRIVVTIALIFSSCILNAQMPDSTRRELLELLNDRKEMFSEYSASLGKKSGIFGNRTKNDMRESHETLRDIVEADNKIMDVLNRALDYRNFEKLNYTFESGRNEERIRSLIILNDTLVRQTEFFRAENKMYRAELKRYRFYCTVLFLILLAGTIVMLRKYYRRLSR